MSTDIVLGNVYRVKFLTTVHVFVVVVRLPPGVFPSLIVEALWSDGAVGPCMKRDLLPVEGN